MQKMSVSDYSYEKGKILLTLNEKTSNFLMKTIEANLDKVILCRYGFRVLMADGSISPLSISFDEKAWFDMRELLKVDDFVLRFVDLKNVKMIKNTLLDINLEADLVAVWNFDTPNKVLLKIVSISKNYSEYGSVYDCRKIAGNIVIRMDKNAASYLQNLIKSNPKKILLTEEGFLIKEPGKRSMPVRLDFPEFTFSILDSENYEQGYLLFFENIEKGVVTKFDMFGVSSVERENISWTVDPGNLIQMTIY